MKKLIVLMAFLTVFIFGYAKVYSQQVQPTIDYNGQPPTDTDLDGLTDHGELQLYNTDSKNPDSDGDGYYDGVEVLAETDPLDANSIPGMPPVVQDVQNETPWPWYISRVSGLVGFTLLYLSIFLGLTLRIPFLRKIFAPLFAMQGHCWIAFQATLFALIHGTVLIFDKFMGFKLADVFVPFASSYKPIFVGLGTIGFYLMIIITISSYARKFLSQKLWRALHFMNIILYIFVIVHAYYLGTDMKNDIVRNIFIYSNVLLVLLMLTNMVLRIKEKIARKNAITENNQNIA